MKKDNQKEAKRMEAKALKAKMAEQEKIDPTPIDPRIAELIEAGYAEAGTWCESAVNAFYRQLEITRDAEKRATDAEAKAAKKPRAPKGSAKVKAQPKTVWDRALAAPDSDKILDSKCRSRIMRAMYLEDKDWVLDGQEAVEDMRVIGNLYSLGFLTAEAIEVFKGFMSYTPARIEKSVKADIIAAAKAAKSNDK